MTPLHYSVNNGNLGVVEYLIIHGADINSCNCDFDCSCLMRLLFILLLTMAIILLLNI